MKQSPAKLQNNFTQFLFYKSPTGQVKIEIFLRGETVWLTQDKIATLFDVQRPAITKHLNNIFETRELVEDSVSSILEHTAHDGKKYKTKFYNLDAIIAVGYRVNSKKATHFRIWATNILKEYIIKGFAMDDERLKDPYNIFGKDYFDEQLKEKYIPHCIEPSLGVDRLILALICSAYAEDEVGGEKRSLLKFDPKIAPIKVAVLPLVKNKEELVKVARDLFDKLQTRWNVQWDAAGAIGRRYRRADEVGTPFCITVDFETIEDDNAVTIRDRDTTEQIRIPLDEVIPYLSKAIDGY